MKSDLMVIPPRNGDLITFCEKLGRAMSLSGMFKLQNVEQGTIVAMTCAMENITPLDFFRRYHIIQGRPAMRSDYMLADFNSRGGKLEIHELSPDVVDVTLTAKSGASLRTRRTWDEMQKEPWPWNDKNDHSQGLKDNWSTPGQRENMMFVRVVSSALRKVCPEIVAGVYTVEEVEDMVYDEPTQPTNVVVAEIKPEEPSRQEDIKADLEDMESQLEKGVQLCSQDQVTEMQQLFDECKIPPERQKQACTDRGVDTLYELTSAQADEIIARLKDYKAKRKN